MWAELPAGDFPQTDPDSNLGNPGAGAPFEQSN